MKQLVFFISLFLCLILKAQPGGGYIKFVDSTQINISPKVFTFDEPIFPFFDANAQVVYNYDSTTIRRSGSAFETLYDKENNKWTMKNNVVNKFVNIYVMCPSIYDYNVVTEIYNVSRLTIYYNKDFTIRQVIAVSEFFDDKGILQKRRTTFDQPIYYVTIK